jgi:hypothetical protein
MDNAANESNFRDVFEREGRELTAIGNKFQIRYVETNQTPLKNDEHIDYLLHRLFAIIYMLLKLRNWKLKKRSNYFLNNAAYAA